ncbi:MAG: APC family permease, partial [Phycisphaerales bacterium]|nr:APC family permease [Phycisphaerales bacterium]
MDKLKRTLTLPYLLFYGVGVIIGAGIYSIIGAAAGQAGRGVWVSLLLAAVPAALAALCYAELSSQFPRAGASYVYVREALPQWHWPGFMIGFIVVCTTAATAATVSIAFGGYLSVFLSWPYWLSASVLLVACTVVNLIGIRESAWVTAICTAIEVIGLVLIIGAGVASHNVTEGLFEFDHNGGQAWDGIFAAAALSFFVFTGFEGLANLAEETKKPKRDLPLALLISLAFTTILYLLVAVAVTALLEPAQLARSDSPLASAATAADPRLGTALTWIALFSTANTVLITVVVGSRLLYGMANEGDMPGALARTLPRRRTPWV